MKRICPKCGRKYDEMPAISRDDNATEICPECGMNEALKAFFQYGNGGKKNGQDN